MRVKIDTIDAKIDEMNKTIYKATGAAMLGGALIGMGVTVAVAILNGG
jgi:formate/nitrite transporter FocA (FNT family)